MKKIYPCPSHITTPDWLKYLRLKAQYQKLNGKWASINGRRNELLFDVALLAGSTVHQSGADLMEYYVTVLKPRANASGADAYTKVVAEVVRQKAEEAIELDGKLSAAWAKLVAKEEALEAWAQKIDAPKEN